MDITDLRNLGITSRDDLASFQLLIRDHSQAKRAGGGSLEMERQHHTGIAPPPSARRRVEVGGGYGDSDEDNAMMLGAATRRAAARPATARPGGQIRGRRNSILYSHSNGSNSGIPRAHPGGTSNALSPPMPSSHHMPAQPATSSMGGSGGGGSGEKRPASSRKPGGMLPPPGNPAIASVARRQSLAYPNRGAAAGGRPGDYYKGAAPATVGRSRTITNRGGAAAGYSALAGSKQPLPRNGISTILERSDALTQSQRLAEDSDEDLERVVRQTGQSKLVNAYGVPTRPATGHAKRGANGRRSLAPGAGSGLGQLGGSGNSAAGTSRPHGKKLARRGSRGESSFGPGDAPVRELPPSNLDDKIRVCVRKRPLNSRERDKGEKDIVVANSSRKLSVMEPKVKVDMTRYIEECRFVFDEVFDEKTDNAQVYERTAKPLVEYVFSGGNAMCFAYGQTGSGKTYTMMDMHNGLYIQAAVDIFDLLSLEEFSHLTAFVAFYEIYLTNLFDLLNDRKKLFAREDANQSVQVQGVREVAIYSPEDLMGVFEFGNNCRSTGSTGANADSSRSHAIMQIILKDTSQRRPTEYGKLSFIDLAGNERGADRGDKADKQTMMEGSEINKSLLALKECIRALDLNKKHLPFRQSKLTQVLKDSFIGNSRACMVATISPNTCNSDNTLNTLRYADRVKAMKTTSSSSANNTTFASGGGANPNMLLSGEHMIVEEDEDEYEEELMEDETTTCRLPPNYDDDSHERRMHDSGNSNHGGYPSSPPPELFPDEEEADMMSGVEIASPIRDEQPSFIDDDRIMSARSPTPKSYGSPAAKRYVASRMLPKTNDTTSAMSFGAQQSSVAAPRSHAAPPGMLRSTSANVTSSVGQPLLSPGINSADEQARYNSQTMSRMTEQRQGSLSLPPYDALNVPDVDALVKLHRGEIRATTEACKEETLLISTYTSFSYAQLVQQARNKANGVSAKSNNGSSWSSLPDKYELDINTGAVTRTTDGVRFASVDEAKQTEAHEYLEKLDEVLDRKQQLVVELRKEIRRLMWNTK